MNRRGKNQIVSPRHNAAILSALIILFTGCSRNSGNGDKAADENKTYNKAATGYEFTDRMITEQKTYMITPYGRTESEQKFGRAVRRKIIDSDENVLIFEREVVWYSAQQKGAQSTEGDFSYDSETSPSEDIPVHLAAQALEIGEMLTVTLTTDGKLLSVSGSELSVTRMKEQLEKHFGTPVEENSPQMFQLNSYYSPDAVKKRIELEISSYIPRGSGRNYSWKTKDLQQFGNILMTFRYRYLGRENSMEKLSFNQKVSLLKDSTSFDEVTLGSGAAEYLQGFSYTKAAGRGDGTLWIIPDTGWIHHGSIRLQIEYGMEIKSAAGKKDQYRTLYEIETVYSEF